jgi:glycosyltransferase involved in cell wall biosynthesis
MRFLIDAHHLGARATGNETWVAEIIAAASELVLSGEIEDQVHVATTGDGYDLADALHIHPELRGGAMRRLVWDIPHLARAVSANAILVQYTIPVTRRPTVVAIHDLSFEQPASKNWIPRIERQRMRTTIRFSARAADHVIALSHHTAADLVSSWDVPPDKISVALPAIGSTRARLLDRARSTHGSGRSRTILAVGNVVPRKNLAMLSRAVVAVRRRGIDVRLRVVGQVPSLGEPVLAELQANLGEALEVTGYVDDQQLAVEYAMAGVLCFPSLYEGFGIPVLEAMAAGTPVIASSATALPEAVGTAGIIASPHDAAEWADAIEMIIDDPVTAETLRDAGRKHVEAFSWLTTTRTVLSAMRAVAT